MLVYLPNCAFLDGTLRQELINWHMKPDSAALFNVYIATVTPHEVAHQWWGHTVATRSYRDEWMREGFADESASIFLQETHQMSQFMEFWKWQRKLITD
jgi:aminopeptidase N